MADLYSTLGVARGADEAEVKKAYRKLAKELHPDRNKDNPQASARFSKATTAYDILSDKDKRARYDRGEIDEDGNPRMPFGYGGAPGGGGGGGPNGHAGFGGEADLSDLFEGLFTRGGGARPGGGGFGGFSGFGGGRSAPPPKGADIAYRLEVPFEDAAVLKEQRVTLRGGKTLDIRLPAGVEDGTRIRLAGQGEPGPGGAGDAIVTIALAAHAFYVRDGDHVRLDLPVALDEAVLGGKVRVPTVDGPVMLNVPANSTTGRTLRLKGRGFTGKAGTRGDQLVTLHVALPADDPEIKAFAEGWSGRGQSNPRAHLGV